MQALGTTGAGQVTELRQDLDGDGMMQQVPAGASTGTISVAEMQPLEIRGYRVEWGSDDGSSGVAGNDAAGAEVG